MDFQVHMKGGRTWILNMLRDYADILEDLTEAVAAINNSYSFFEMMEEEVEGA